MIVVTGDSSVLVYYIGTGKLWWINGNSLYRSPLVSVLWSVFCVSKELHAVNPHDVTNFLIESIVHNWFEKD